jgi:DNA-binding NtrC family response regulator
MSEGHSSASILFVDDEPSIRLTLPPILVEQGFTVRVAASVASALAEISTHKFDVLLSDLNISKPRDGFLVMNAARAANPLCVAILLTGCPDFDGEAEVEKNDLDGYLVKPADIENLMNIIDQKLASRISSQHPDRQNTERI